jgi:Schlafen group 3, DNA/RNA helicase domain
MMLRPPSPHRTARCGVLGSKRSAAATLTPCVLASHSAIAPWRRASFFSSLCKQYGGESSRTPKEHIWVYNEAQRAWDAQRVREFCGHDRSEPEDFLSIGSRKDSWGLMVGLIGEGQEIHVGEEAGLAQWNDAIAKTSDSWTVHCPRKIADVFDAAERLETSESLDLDMSLRTHLAEDVQGWAQDLLDGRLDAAVAHAEAMERQGFRLYLTRELERATKYVRERLVA